MVAIFSSAGKILREEKFQTSKNYNDWLAELAAVAKKIAEEQKVVAACCAIPAVELDRAAGIAKSYGNLPWRDTPIQSDLARIFGDLPVAVENDAKLAGLYEANTISGFKRVLYVPIGTGVGTALIVNGVIDKEFGDAGGRGLVLEYEGKLTAWDDIASGRAIAERYGKKASEINDPKIWQEYVKPLARGLELLVGLTEQPDVIIIGGGVGAHFDKFGNFLKEELRKYETDKIKIPPLKEATKPEEAAVYGCYQYLKRKN